MDLNIIQVGIFKKVISLEEKSKNSFKKVSLVPWQTLATRGQLGSAFEDPFIKESSYHLQFPRNL